MYNAASPAAAAAATSAVGFLLFDSSMNPITVNCPAVEILVYPQRPEAVRNLDHFLLGRIRSALLAPQSSSGSPLVNEFRSGKRLYLCRSFRIDSRTKGQSQPAVAVLLERGTSESFSLFQVSQKYHLTAREQEVLRFLLQGLTNKEIAARLEISANTVKAFLRLLMIKMGVSTRSGVVGRAVTVKP